jgi:ribosome biogenesis protein Tsr3
MDLWGLTNENHENLSLAQCASLARKACNLPYLVGAAPVVYGLPMYLSK